MNDSDLLQMLKDYVKETKADISGLETLIKSRKSQVSKLEVEISKLESRLRGQQDLFD